MTGYGVSGIELAWSMRAGQAQHVAGIFHHGHLHAQADAQKRARCSRGHTARRQILPSIPRLAEAAGYKNAVATRQLFGARFLGVTSSAAIHSTRTFASYGQCRRESAPQRWKDTRPAARHTCQRWRCAHAFCGVSRRSTISRHSVRSASGAEMPSRRQTRSSMPSS